jgi:23S rRNA (adenine2503-C2)-methyltransferase
LSANVTSTGAAPRVQPLPADVLAVASDSPRINFLGMPPAQLTELFESLGERPFRARQILQWLYKHHVLDFGAMTDLSAALRRELEAIATVAAPPVITSEHSVDGTRKWLLDVGAGQAIETVFIPEPNRGTLCISSQAGCALDCAFCATGHQGFNRNLTSAEIRGQVVLAARDLAPTEITNIVFMGMGEPLANYKNVLPVLKLLLDDLAFGVSRRRVTISTAGIVPHIRRLASDCNVALAVSLHATTDALRDRLVPINKVHPIAELLDACWEYAEGIASRQITFEYVLLDGVNDSPADARRLIGLLEGHPAKVNLIPFNPFPASQFRCSAPDTIERFWRIVRDSGLITTIRRPRGDDIAAACGQLAGRVRDRQRVRLGDKTMMGVSNP